MDGTTAPACTTTTEYSVAMYVAEPMLPIRYTYLPLPLLLLLLRSKYGVAVGGMATSIAWSPESPSIIVQGYHPRAQGSQVLVRCC